MASEQDVRAAHFTNMLITYGREAEPVAVAGLVRGTAIIPLHVLGEAILSAERWKTDGFPPTVGEIINAARGEGRWHDPENGKLRDPYWFTGAQPHPIESHAPANTPKALSSAEMDRAAMRREAERDIAAHAVHQRTGLVPSRCVRCVLDLHAEHTEPVDNCLRCQVGAAA